jgi:hypothetical protein
VRDISVLDRFETVSFDIHVYKYCASKLIVIIGICVEH